MSTTFPIVYNVTCLVSHTIAAQWLLWMQQQHIPAVMATGCFTKYHIYKLLEQDESEGLTYTVQYFAESHQAYETYISEFATNLRKETNATWGEAVIGFRSLMQVVH